MIDRTCKGSNEKGLSPDHTPGMVKDLETSSASFPRRRFKLKDQFAWNGKALGATSFSIN